MNIISCMCLSSQKQFSIFKCIIKARDSFFFNFVYYVQRMLKCHGPFVKTKEIEEKQQKKIENLFLLSYIYC